MTQRHVLVIGGPSSTLDKLDKLGVRYSMMQTPELVEERQSRHAQRYAALDYRSSDEMLRLAREWHAADPVAAVISFTEYGLEPASRCAFELGVAGDNLRAVRLTRDKRRTRDVLARHGLSPVRHRVCAAIEDAREFLAEMAGEPIVLKPCDGGLSEGVLLAESEAELAERWDVTHAAAAGPVLAEEFLRGPEYSVESISVNGRHEVVMITEKLTTTTPRFVELGHQVPARLGDDVRNEIADLVVRFLALIDQQTGPAHTELRLTPSGPRIIESQTRVGGDQVWELCELVSGVDLMAETIAALLELPAPQRCPVAAAAAIRFFAYENARILSVEDLPVAEQARGVLRVTCSLQPGQEVGALDSSTSRQGYVLCEGSGVDDAITNAETARDLVKVTWEPPRVTTLA